MARATWAVEETGALKETALRALVARTPARKDILDGEDAGFESVNQSCSLSGFAAAVACPVFLRRFTAHS